MPLKKDIKLVRSLQQKKFRNEHGLFLVEGHKMVEEALTSSFRIHSLYSTDNTEMMTALNSPSSHLVVLYKKENSFSEIHHLNDDVLILDGIADQF